LPEAEATALLELAATPAAFIEDTRAEAAE
jgi:hypothetical protein